MFAFHFYARRAMESFRYEDVRRVFERLKLEDKVRFLIEATAVTLADGIEAAGAALSRGLERCMAARSPKVSSDRPASEG
ncbi:hypothetical protein RHBI111906_05040 [Rhodothermus bifroesti]|nr:hypothetical protein HRbin18_00604 [bacterium HR18]